MLKAFFIGVGIFLLVIGVSLHTVDSYTVRPSVTAQATGAWYGPMQREAVIQAGSMQWPLIRREEDDDGRINTHFAYEWTPREAASAFSVAMGNLPEMHCWVGLLDTQEIVDFSTRHLKAAAATAGLAWSAADPPDYLWCPGNALPDWVVYRPNREASVYANTLLKRLFDPVYHSQWTVYVRGIAWFRPPHVRHESDGKEFTSWP